jgi:hypothetical protein
MFDQSISMWHLQPAWEENYLALISAVTSSAVTIVAAQTMNSSVIAANDEVKYFIGRWRRRSMKAADSNTNDENTNNAIIRPRTQLSYHNAMARTQTQLAAWLVVRPYLYRSFVVVDAQLWHQLVNIQCYSLLYAYNAIT